VNDSKEPNLIDANFFLPIPLGKKSKVMIGGTGQSCVLKNFTCKSFIKFDSSDSDRKKCDCCSII
jgi:hypothetical protein